MGSQTAAIFLLTSLAGGGSQRKTIRLTNALVREGHTVHLCYLDRKEELLSALETAPNLHVDCLERDGRFDVGAMRRFARLAAAYPTGTIVAVNPYPVFFAANSLGSSRSRYKFVAATNTYTFASSKEAFLFQVFQKRLYREADLALFGSFAQKERWCGKYAIDASKAAVIYNGVDLEYYSPDIPLEPFSTRANQSAIVIVFIASLTPHKRHIDLLEAARLVLACGLEVSLVFVGAGPLAGSLEKRARKMNLHHRVTFVGFVEDVRPYLKAADIAVLTSNAVETFSNAIVESMAMGKPVIASNIGGAAEQVSHGVNGLLFEPGNVEELASCIMTMCDRDRRLEAGRASRRIAVERFGLDRMVESYKRILE